jgi:alanyl-tRNA synthetase
MKSQELRQAWIDFFTERGHALLPSASLVPHEMSTTLFTIAGMEQFVPVFLGEQPPPGPRAVTVQRCLRVAGAKSDIENVGRTGRHGTFLEMLGNFSFGDYYKREAIGWAWEFSTKVLRLDPTRLYVTVHTGDDEAERIWIDEIGLEPSRISRWDEDNFWTMGPTGPCGPCSELFYDLGPEYSSGPHDDGPNKGDRFVEFWNVVFQQFNRGADGKMSDLPRKAIDTGAGFERMLAICNGQSSMYDTDLFGDIIATLPKPERQVDAAQLRVRQNIVADHARAVTFLLNDGVYPSNTDRGYVLRFLIRRAIANGRLLGFPNGFLADVVPAVVTSLESGYPELRQNQTRIQSALAMEERTFERTLERGMSMLDRIVQEAERTSSREISGDQAFVLHDTYGFPIELTREIAAERGATVDAVEFERLMTEQRQRARSDAEAKRAIVGVVDLPAVRSEFTGYEGLEGSGEVVALLRDEAPVPILTAGQEGTIVLDSSSFYAERGGQIGDRGTIETDGGAFEVKDTQLLGEAIAHHGIVVSGEIATGERVRTTVFDWWRREIRRHHTSAHLLQRALKDVLGDEVNQAGSWVGTDRMRFDFRWPGGALSPEQKRAVAHRVNEMIREDSHLETRVLPIEEAKQSGAIWMAGEKYGDAVRVVSAGPAIEFCGGTHSHSTGELGVFLILSESSIGSGVRRIESCVSASAEATIERQGEMLNRLSTALATSPEDIGERIERLQRELRETQASRDQLKAQLASADAQSYLDGAEECDGKRFVGAIVAGADAEALKHLSGAIRSKLRSGVIGLIGTNGETVSVLVNVSDDLVKSGVHAGNLVKVAAPLVGGRGGGQPASAQGGGKNPGGAQDALAAIRAGVLE